MIIPDNEAPGDLREQAPFGEVSSPTGVVGGGAKRRVTSVRSGRFGGFRVPAPGSSTDGRRRKQHSIKERKGALFCTCEIFCIQAWADPA